jgi:hypothetical protein
MNATMDNICYGSDLLISKKIGWVVGNLLFSKVLSPPHVLLYWKNLFVLHISRVIGKVILSLGLLSPPVPSFCKVMKFD